MKRISTRIFHIIYLHIFILVLLAPLSTFAQDTYLPILEVGKRWTHINYAVSGELHGPATPWTWKAIDMAEEDGHQVFTILREDSELEGYDDELADTRKRYEEDGVLWYFLDEYGEYKPMMDFNLEVGDNVIGAFKVVWKGDVDIEGVMRCVIAIDNGLGKMNYWIEGIGAADDVYLSSGIRPIGERTRMTECWMGDTCLFNYDRMDEYMAGIDLSNVKIQTKEEATAPCYDILGRRIADSAPGQLYIKNGRKHIAK